MRNSELYGNLPRLTDKIRQRRMGLAGEIATSDLILWEPTLGRRNRGQGQTTLRLPQERQGAQQRCRSSNIVEEQDEWCAAIRASRVGIG